MHVRTLVVAFHFLQTLHCCHMRAWRCVQELFRSVIGITFRALGNNFENAIWKQSAQLDRFIPGVVPLVVTTGAGPASRQSLGTAVLGGMLMATVLTLAGSIPRALWTMVNEWLQLGSVAPTLPRNKKNEGILYRGGLMPIAVDFLPVGDSNGDAIVIKYGEGDTFYLQVVDGGYAQIGEEMIAHIETHYGKGVVITDMVVSHADNDHAKGLIPVYKHFQVANLWMNRPWLYAQEVLDQFHGNWSLEGWIKEVRDKHEYLVELETLARARGMEPKEVFQGAQIGPFHVLAPSRERYITLIPDLDKTPPPYKSETAGLGRGLFELAKNVLNAIKETMDVETLDPNPPATSASNETSVVQLGIYDGRKILLTADVGPAGLTEAALYAHSRGILSAPDMIQIPHQGSRRNVTPAVLDAWLGEPNGGNPRRGAALVMVGKNKTEHPRKKVKNAFIRRGYPVFVSRSTSWMHMPYGYDPRGPTMTAEPFSHDVEDD